MTKKILFSVLLAFVTVLAFSQDQSPEAIKAKLIETSRKLTALNCEFIQTRESSLLSDAMISTGRMSYRKPDYLEWTYLKPFEMSFIIDGNSVSITKDGVTKTADSGQNKVVKEMGRMIKGSIEGGFLASDSMFETLISSAEGVVTVELYPKNKEMKKFWTKMVLRYNMKDFSAKSFEMHEISGDVTSITFKNSRYEFSE